MDQLLRGVFKNRAIRVSIVNSSLTCKEICSKHKTSPVCSDALSRLISVGSMMSGMIKDGRLSLKIAGNGPIEQMIVDASSNGCIRGFIKNPQVDIPKKQNGKLDVGSAVGNLGVLTVTKHIGLKQDFIGDVILTNGEIGEDFCYYFYKSEQTPSVVVVGTIVDVDYSVQVAGGLILQLLPNAKEEDIVYAEEATKKMTSITKLLLENNGDVKKVAEALFNDELEGVEITPIKFKCDCSKERFISGIATLPEKDILEMIKEDKGCEVKCEFCGNTYKFDNDDLNYALEMKRKLKEKN